MRVPAFHRAQLALPVAAFLVLGCVLPLALLVAFSFFTVDLDSFTITPAFSGQSWSQIFTNPVFAFLIGKAVISGAGTAVLAAVTGYPVAIAMARLPVLWKGVASIVLLTPLYTGEIVRIYAWRIVLGSEGLVNAALHWLGIIDKPMKFLLFSPFSTHLALLYNNLPFMVLTIWVSAELIDKRLIEAARDLGARPIDAFFRVILPLTTPGLAVGMFTVFALAAGDMTTPSLLGGTSGATAMAMIDNLFGTAFDWPMASALSISLLVVLFALAGGFLIILLRFNGARAVFRKGVR